MSGQQIHVNTTNNRPAAPVRMEHLTGAVLCALQCHAKFFTKTPTGYL